MKIKFDNIYKCSLLLNIMILFLIRPGYILHTKIRIIFDIGLYITEIVIWFLLIFSRNNSLKNIIPFFIYCGVIIFSTFVNEGNMMECIKQLVPLLTACVLFQLWCEKSPVTLMKSRFIFEVVTYINLMTIIVFPRGLYTGADYSSNWFLGFNNIHIRTILPGLALSYMYTYYKNNRIDIRTICFSIATVLTVLLVQSSTSEVGVIIFLMLFFIFKKFNYKKVLKNFNLYVFCAIILILNILILMQSKINFIAYFVEHILHKDMTFTGRDFIWNNAIDCIQQKILLGYGFLTENEFIQLLRYKLASHPHNLLLYIMMMGGFVLLIVFGYIIIKSAYKLSKCKSDLSYIVLSVICAFLFMGIAESLVGTKMFLPMFVLAININKFEERKETTT